MRPGVDPAWTRDDRLFALAWQAEEAEKCSGCGRLWSETGDPDAFEDYTAHVHVCWSCAERQRMIREVAGGEKGLASTDGRYVTVTRRDDA